MNIVQGGIPSNGPAMLQIGNARLTRDELVSLLIQAGHPDPNVACVWLMNGTARQTIIPRTAQDVMNEMQLQEANKKLAVLSRALRIRLSPLQVQVLDLAEKWVGSEAVSRELSMSQQQAHNVIAKLLDLGLLERKAMGDGRVRLYRSRVAVVSGTPERPTRFCGVCGHPSVSAYAGGWKCRDCGAVVSGTPPPEEQT
jgi:predicted DNA-binding transcriptional regulator